jgi:hypothetical protein
VSGNEILRFEIVVDCPEQALGAKLKRNLAARDCGCIGWVEARGAELRVPKLERHFWSPRLQLRFDPDSRGGRTLVQGSFRPEPGVWTGIVFAHCLLGGLATAGLSLGLAQWTLGDPPTALLGTLLGILLSAGLYFGTLAGAQLGRAQMQMLRKELHRAVRCELMGSRGC